jgi:protein TonB
MLILILAAALAGAPQVAAEPVSIIVTHPQWLTKPTAEDLANFHPRAGNANLGVATISCRITVEGCLRDCAVISERPLGEGFGDAALSIAAKYRMRTTSDDGQDFVGGTVRIPIRFRPKPP